MIGMKSSSGLVSRQSVQVRMYDVFRVANAAPGGTAFKPLTLRGHDHCQLRVQEIAMSLSQGLVRQTDACPTTEQGTT
jgi:hypothetical protein